jgi:hypothetical protein
MTGAAAGAAFGILSFLGCIFWFLRRKLQSRDRAVRIIQGGADYPDLVGTEITPYHYQPQAGAGAEPSLSNLESGLDLSRSDPSGPRAEMGCGSGRLATLGTSTGTPSVDISMMKHSLAMMGYSNSYGIGGDSPSTAFPPPQSHSPLSAKERGRTRKATGPRDSEVEVEALPSQRSDNGRNHILQQVEPSVTGETPSPHVEVGTVRHMDGPDPDMGLRQGTLLWNEDTLDLISHYGML